MINRLRHDRNFDDIAERFEQRIYGKLKGRIRQAIIWRDLNQTISQLRNTQPKHILDVGAGLGYFTQQLAQQGHQVYYNELSEKLTASAKLTAELQGLHEQIQWYNCAYQVLLQNKKLPAMDLILCHALIEWLAEPEQLLPQLAAQLKPKGLLSFCFYNPAGMTYRNLMAGNFHAIEQQQTYQPDQKTLTPPSPPTVKQVFHWLNDAGFVVLKQSGIRVFTDYAMDKQRGGHQYPEQVLAKELEFSDQYPFYHMGRYIHVIAIRRSL